MEPVAVASARQLAQLHPSQIGWISIQLLSLDADDENEPVKFSARADGGRTSIQDLVHFAQLAQPEGTSVIAWHQGRTEEFLI